MTKRYETVFILTPVLSVDQVKETVVNFKKFLKDSGAKLMHEEDWGLRKFKKNQQVFTICLSTK